MLPEGPGAGHLEPGDILLAIGAEEDQDTDADTGMRLLTTFVPLEEVLDARVGQRVVLRTQRGGAERVVTLEVQDLHALVPTKLLCISSAILHPVTLHIAKVRVDLDLCGLLDGWLGVCVQARQTQRPDLPFCHFIHSTPP